MKKEGKGEYQDHAVTFIGTWVNNMMQGTFILKQKEEEEKKAKYDKGVFVEWIGYNSNSNKVLNEDDGGQANGDVKVGNSQGKKKGICC